MFITDINISKGLVKSRENKGKLGKSIFNVFLRLRGVTQRLVLFFSLKRTNILYMLATLSNKIILSNWMAEPYPALGGMDSQNKQGEFLEHSFYLKLFQTV